jgi:hypothetical protein
MLGQVNAASAREFILDGALCWTSSLWSLRRFHRKTALFWATESKKPISTLDVLCHPVLSHHFPALATRTFLPRWSNGIEVPLDGSFNRFLEGEIAGLNEICRLAPPDRVEFLGNCYRVQQPVSRSLVISLAVVVRHVLCNRAPK